MVKRVVGLVAACLLLVVGLCIGLIVAGGLPPFVADIVERQRTPGGVPASPTGLDVPLRQAAPVSIPPTAVPVPTATPSPGPTATPRPSATPPPSATFTPALPRAAVSSDTLNVRTGPGTAYPIVTALRRGDEVTVTGRNKAGNWLQVVLDSGKKGWVWAEYVKLSTGLGQIALVPDIPPPPTSAATRTPRPTVVVPRVTFDEVCSHIGQRVTVQGTIGSLGFVVFCSDRCSVYLHEIGGQKRELRTRILVGSGKNRMEPLHDNFKDSDLKIHTASGQVVGVGARVDMTGTVTEFTSQSDILLPCGLDVDTIVAR